MPWKVANIELIVFRNYCGYRRGHSHRHLGRSPPGCHRPPAPKIHPRRTRTRAGREYLSIQSPRLSHSHRLLKCASTPAFASNPTTPRLLAQEAPLDEFGLYSFIECGDNSGPDFVSYTVCLRPLRTLIIFFAVWLVRSRLLRLIPGTDRRNTRGRGDLPDHLPRGHTPPRTCTVICRQNQPLEPASQVDALEGLRPRHLPRSSRRGGSSAHPSLRGPADVQAPGPIP